MVDAQTSTRPYPFSAIKDNLFASLSATIYDIAVTASVTTRISLLRNKAHRVRIPPDSTKFAYKTIILVYMIQF